MFRYITLLYEVKSRFDLTLFVNELRAFVQRGVYTINGIALDGVSENDLKVYRDLFGDLGVAQISYLINQISAMNSNNLEMSLMMLGYTGIAVQPPYGSGDGVFKAELVAPDKELAKEAGMASKVLKEKQEVERARGIKNAENLMGEVSMVDILSSFGGVMVEDGSQG